MMVSVWVYVGLALLIVFSLGVFVGALVGSPGPWRQRGGTVDLTGAAARGELDLDWSDTRPLNTTFAAPKLIFGPPHDPRSSNRDDPERRPSFGV